MDFLDFDLQKPQLDKQYDNINWLQDSGITKAQAQEKVEQLLCDKTLSVPMARAKALCYTINNCRIAIDKTDIFQDKIDARGMFNRYNWEFTVNAAKESDPELFDRKIEANDLGLYSANHDYGHNSPNSRDLLELGFGGMANNIHRQLEAENISEKQRDFYNACLMTLDAAGTLALRLADAIRPYNKENAECLCNISKKAPQNTYEAMQLIIIYFVVHEFVMGSRVRTLGRVDKLFLPFYKNDIKNGTFTAEQIKQLFKYFLNKFWVMKVPYDQPLMLGGMDVDGTEVTNEISYMVVEAYNELNVHSPKIHIRVSQNTPESFVKLVLSCIRGGNSSFVFCNDAVAIASLEKVGITTQEARDYVLIGCYEAAAWGVEMPCTGNSSLNLAKCAELAMNDGCDMATGKRIGVQTGDIKTYDDFVNAVKDQIRHAVHGATEYICAVEKLYPTVYADTMISAMYRECVKNGTDAYSGGAKYNNSSLTFAGIATLTDIMAAVKRVVFDQNKISFADLCTLMKNNWKGNEKLRLYCSGIAEKYGNGNATADNIAKEMASFAAGLVNGKPNGRGGIFKAGLFSIDRCFMWGERTAATPDGRRAGEPISKNLCATTAKDKNGITALAASVAKTNLSDFSNGSVLDIIMHPSAVSGEDGLCAMYGVLKTFFGCGGFAMHGNVFDASCLRNAQLEPEKYATLQVRVCGWNVFFVNLSKKEQDEFIKQTEHIM